jgi:hypothetical protein
MKRNEQKRRDVVQRRNCIDEDTLDSLLHRGYWKEEDHSRTQSLPWEEIKKKLAKDKNVKLGLRLLQE